MMQLVGLLVFILVIGLLIVTHEFGHFMMARLFKVDVLEFAVGMGPKLFSKVKNGTEYSLRAVPLGGFCSMYGSENEKVKDLPEGVTYSKEGAFKNKPVWQRMIIIVAGSFMNILTCLICSFLFVTLTPYTSTLTIDKVIENTPAYIAGIQAGDVLIKHNDTKLYVQNDLSLAKMFEEGDTVFYTINRNGVEKTVELTPNEDGKLGVFFKELDKTNPLEVIKESLGTFRYNIVSVFKTFQYLVSGKIPMSKITSIIGVAEQVEEAIVETDKLVVASGNGNRAFYVLLSALNVTVLMAANLAVINMFPFPALDGGHFLLLCVEAIRRKKVSDRFELRWNTFGALCLYILMAVVMFKDIFVG